MTNVRERLPNRRASESFAFQCGGMNYIASISRFTDGRLAEIFARLSARSPCSMASRLMLSATPCYATLATSLARPLGWRSIFSRRKSAHHE